MATRDQSQLTDDAAYVLFYDSGSEKIAQSFTPSTTADIAQVILKLYKTASPTGNMFVELRADSSGVPSGTVTATSSTLDVSTLTTSSSGELKTFTFTAGTSLTASTLYWLVLNTDYGVSTVNWVGVLTKGTSSSYAGGSAKKWNGSAWVNLGGLDIDIYFDEYYASASGPANLKSYNTNLKENIKSINTNPIANTKSLDTNV